MSRTKPEPQAAATDDDLRGLGPVSRRWLKDLGIQTANDLQSVDVFDVYSQLKKNHSSVSRNLLYALIGAQERRDWREVARTDRTSVLLRLEQMGLL